jgi:hypothetical protein
MNAYYARLTLVENGVEYRSQHDLVTTIPNAPQTADLVEYIVTGITDTLEDSDGDRPTIDLSGLTPSQFAADLITNEDEWASRGIEWDITTEFQPVDEQWDNPLS